MIEKLLILLIALISTMGVIGSEPAPLSQDALITIGVVMVCCTAIIALLHMEDRSRARQQMRR